MKEKKKMNSNDFIQSDNVIYKLICTVKKRSEDILFTFIVEVSLNTAEATLNNNKNMQIKKSMKNSDTVKLIKNNNTVLLTENSDTVKSINYNDLINMTFESFTYTTIDQLNSTESIDLSEFFILALINSFNFSSSMKNEFKLNDNQLMHKLESMS